MEDVPAEQVALLALPTTLYMAKQDQVLCNYLNGLRYRAETGRRRGAKMLPYESHA